MGADPAADAVDSDITTALDSTMDQGGASNLAEPTAESLAADAEDAVDSGTNDVDPSADVG